MTYFEPIYITGWAKW